MKKSRLKIHRITHQLYQWGNPQKPLLIFLHGWLDTGASFNFVAPYLKDHFYCVAIDLRGYGKSGHIANPLGYFFLEYVADLKELVDQLSPKKPVIIMGHSLGGGVSSFYAGCYPERVSHFINIEAFGFLDRPHSKSPDHLKGWIDSIGTKRFRTHATLKDFARRLQQSNPRLPDERALFLARHLSKKVKGGYVMTADPKHKLMEPYPFQTKIAEEFWKKMRAKCLFIIGKNSVLFEYIPHKEVKRRIKCFPKNSKIASIPHCGHMVHHEQPEALAKVILKFFNHGTVAP